MYSDLLKNKQQRFKHEYEKENVLSLRRNMQKTYSICENGLFKYLYNKGRSFVHPYFIIYCKDNKKDFNRIGITVSKKIGNSVKRNRAKRVLKEAYRIIENEVATGYDFIFVARSKTPFISMNIIKKDMFNTFKKNNFLK